MRGLARGLRWWSVAWVVLAGQATTDVPAVRVYAGEIAVIDVRMGQVAAAPPPALRLGLTTSRTTIEGSSFYDLPVTDPRDVLALQPGVFQSADQTKLSIRGGAAAVYIDGALISRAGLGTNAIEQASVTTGAVGVEAGDAQSGLIAFVTPAGGRRWRAALRIPHGRCRLRRLAERRAASHRGERRRP